MGRITDFGFNRLNRKTISSLTDTQANEGTSDLSSLNRVEIEQTQNTDLLTDIPQSSIKTEMIAEVGAEKIETGEITSQQITLGIGEDGNGDVYLGMGTFTASAWTCAGGILIGLDDSDNNEAKMFMGDSSSSIDWNVTTADTLTVKGSITATTGAIGGFSIGSDYIRDAANSFGLASTVTGGDDVRFWAGDTYANRATAPFRVTEAGVVTATSATISGTITASQIEGGNFTIGIPCTASTEAYDMVPVQVGLSSSGNMTAFFTLNTDLATRFVSVRLQEVAGQFVPVAETGGTTTATSSYTGTERGYIYHNGEYYWSYDTTTLRKGSNAGTAMTFSSNSDAGLLASDDTNFFILDASDNVTVRKYTISGTTATWVSNTTLDTASPDGFFWDGTSFWGRNAGTIKKYNSSGTTTDTYTLSVTPVNLAPGVFTDGGNVYVAYTSYWAEYTGGVSYRRPSALTFIPVAQV